MKENKIVFGWQFQLTMYLCQRCGWLGKKNAIWSLSESQRSISLGLKKEKIAFAYNVPVMVLLCWSARLLHIMFTKLISAVIRKYYILTIFIFHDCCWILQLRFKGNIVYIYDCMIVMLDLANLWPSFIFLLYSQFYKEYLLWRVS